MRLAVRLVDEGREWILVDRVDLDGVVPFRPLEGVHFLHLERGGHELHQLAQHRVNADDVLGRHGEEREEVHPLHRLLHALDRLVAADLDPLEIALEQGIVAGGDRFDQLLKFGCTVGDAPVQNRSAQRAF